jgi:isoaspartyl peptidase/L-asparaginase-like protein (Ntn-hydrolase superfamily)
MGAAVLIGAGVWVAVACAMLATGVGGGLLHAVIAANTSVTNPKRTSFTVISFPVIVSGLNHYPTPDVMIMSVAPEDALSLT